MTPHFPVVSSYISLLAWSSSFWLRKGTCQGPVLRSPFLLGDFICSNNLIVMMIVIIPKGTRLNWQYLSRTHYTLATRLDPKLKIVHGSVSSNHSRVCLLFWALDSVRHSSLSTSDISNLTCLKPTSFFFPSRSLPTDQLFFTLESGTSILQETLTGTFMFALCSSSFVILCPIKRVFLLLALRILSLSFSTNCLAQILAIRTWIPVVEIYNCFLCVWFLIS